MACWRCCATCRRAGAVSRCPSSTGLAGARAARRRLETNLRVALPEASPGDIRYIAWRNFRNHSKAYADLMRLPRARVETLRPLLRLKGVEHLEAARAKGRGVMVISAHMGS